MKFIATLMLMLAFGLSVAYSQDFGDDDFGEVSGDAQQFLDNILLGNGDEDEEIVDMDDALDKLRMLRTVYRIVDDAQAMDLLKHKKRFIGGFFDKIKEAVKKAVKKVGDFFSNVWNKAKSAFEKAKTGLNFQSVIKKLIPYIHSGMTVAGCKKALLAAATAILGPAASVANVVSGPICDGALAQIEKIAG